MGHIGKIRADVVTLTINFAVEKIGKSQKTEKKSRQKIAYKQKGLAEGKGIHRFPYALDGERRRTYLWTSQPMETDGKQHTHV